MPVPQWVINLRNRRDNITQELAEIDNISAREKFGSKPEFAGEAGGTQHTAYRLSLLSELRDINVTLMGAADVISAEGDLDDTDGFTLVSEVDS